MTAPECEVYAIRYATVVRTARDNFLARRPRDSHDSEMPLDFFVWLIRGNGRNVLVDTGFSAESALARRRNFLCPPADALQKLGIGPAAIGDVVITHLHYDNMVENNPFPAIVDVAEMLEGYPRLARLADSNAHIVPGHDPLVRARYRRLPIEGVDIHALHEAPDT